MVRKEKQFTGFAFKVGNIDVRQSGCKADGKIVQISLSKRHGIYRPTKMLKIIKRCLQRLFK